MSGEEQFASTRHSGLPRLLLIFLAVDWPLYMRRPAVRALAEVAREYECTVVAINRPLCPFTTPIRKPARIGELFGQPKLVQLAENLHLYSPRYVIHDHIAHRLPGLTTLNIAVLRRNIRNLQRRLGIEEPNPIVWFNYPQQAYVTRLFAGSFSIFELYDELSTVDGDPLPRAVALEERKRNDVDLLLTTSLALDTKYGRYYPHSIFYGNGVSRSTFSELASERQDLPEKLSAIPRPRLGYAGMLSDRLDWSLLVALAEARPQWQLVFVGPGADEKLIRRCRHQPNMHFTGPVDPAEIPGVLHSFDVGLLPYRDTTFFHFLNPLKFYEMAAAGLPMVSSPIEEMQRFPSELVTVVNNEVNSWQEAIQAALSRARASVTKIGRQVAGDHIWEDMARRLLERIAGLMLEKRKVT